MTTPTGLDLLTAHLKEAAAKFADALRQHASLRAELESAAGEAEAAGFADFAEVFRDMAARLGSFDDHRARGTTPPSKRRGRPPKAAAAEPSLQ